MASSINTGFKSDKSTTQQNTPKSQDNNANILNIESTKQSNILNSYRSYTYNFTLSAVSVNHANSPDVYRKSSENYVILKSGGKGYQGISKGFTTDNQRAGQELVQQINPLSGRISNANPAKALIEGFNAYSPGRFDMYIDNVDITTLMAPNNATGLTLPSKITFDVFEPYSINGFIEALQATAQAAGYTVYSNASFLLKIEFIGYKDKVDLPSPETVKNSARYFLIQFAGMNVELTENGTKYSCTAIPFSDRGFGETGRLQSSVSMSGKTVGEVLKNLMDKVSKRIKSSEATNESQTETDSYYIKFPVRTSKGLDLVSNKENDIAKAKISQNSETLTRLLTHDAVSTGTSAIANTQGTSATLPTFQFKEGVNLHEIITATIRDSEYVKKIVETVKPDEYGMINYFLVNIHVENKPIFDDTKGRPFQIFTFMVTEHRVHYTFIPTYGATQVIDKSKLKTQVLRDYNYIYTGRNVDITTFKLDYNYLYFEAIPRAMGRNNYSGLDNAKVASNANEPEEVANRPKDATESAPIQISSILAGVQPAGQINSAQPDPTAYAAMAKGMHLALTNSVSRLSGEIDIIGDPFYLVTGGIGNYNPVTSSVKPGITNDNEADRFYGQVLISLTFSNPVDINEKTGLLQFNKASSADASGVYMVTEVVSSFKEGAFRQKLKILRIPGQIPNGYNKPTNPGDGIKSGEDASKKSAEVTVIKAAQ